MTGPGDRPRVPASGLAFGGMLSVQLGSALSVGLVTTVGPAGTAWLRLGVGAVVFLLLARPRLGMLRGHLAPVLGLGVTTGLMSVAFLAAIERIPLGTAVAVEFLGPLTVAAARGRGARALVWPGLALVGVTVLTEPWRGAVDLPGLGCAGLAAMGWAAYILLTQEVGDRISGIRGLALTVPVAAVAAAVVGVPQAAGHLSPAVVLAAAGLALLNPVVPFALELLALRRMTSSAFGTLMAVEPALGALLGLVVLHQRPSALQAVGVLLVVLAGAAAQRGSDRAQQVDATRPPASAPA